MSAARWASFGLLIGAAQLLGQGCSFFQDVVDNKPLTYGAELAHCETVSKSWAEYTSCCVDVATRYGRGPGFCYPDAKDGGGQ